MSAAAMGLLESLCGLYLKDEQQILKMATHRNCGPMLVDAAFASLPRPKSKQVQYFCLACCVSTLIKLMEGGWP